MTIFGGYYLTGSLISILRLSNCHYAIGVVLISFLCHYTHVGHLCLAGSPAPHKSQLPCQKNGKRESPKYRKKDRINA